MSETQTQQPEYRPQNVLQAEEGEDATQPLQPPQEAPQPAEKPAESPAEDKPEDGEEDERKRERRREAQRIGYLTKQRYAEKARADAAEQRLREYEQAIARQSGQAHTPSQEEFRAAVEQAAAQKIAADARNEKFRAWEAQGSDTFGAEKFLEACNTVANFAGTDAQRGALVDVLLDTEGGQRALMELAGNAAEAERVLAMPPHRMALAIAKLGAEPAKPVKPVSNAPPPIRPPQAGRARGEPDPEHGSMDDYFRWSATRGNWRR